MYIVCMVCIMYVCMYVAVPRQDSRAHAVLSGHCNIFVKQATCMNPTYIAQDSICSYNSPVRSFIHVGCLGISNKYVCMYGMVCMVWYVCVTRYPDKEWLPVVR